MLTPPLPKPSSAHPDHDAADATWCTRRDLRRLPSTTSITQPPVYVLKAGCTQADQSHFADRDCIFKGLLQQLLEEHEKIVAEIANLRKENSQLRAECTSEGHEHLTRLDPADKERVRSGMEETASPREDISNSNGISGVLLHHDRSDNDLVTTACSKAPSKSSTAPSTVTRLQTETRLSPQLNTSSVIQSKQKLSWRTTRSGTLMTIRRPTLSRLLGPGPPEMCMISPVSRGRLMWDFVAFCCLLVDLWATPVQLVFMAEDIVPMELHVLNIATIFFFLLDIILNFNTGFIIRDKLVMQRIPSIKRYLSFWFWIDVLATVPFDLILKAMLVTFDGGVLSVARLTRLTKLMKMLKTLRFLKLLRMLRLIKQMGHSTSFLEFSLSVKFAIRVLQLFSVLGFMAHLHGCIWGLLQPSMAHQDNLDLAFLYYYQSLRWAYNAICVGEMGSSLAESPGIWTLEMTIASERILMALFLGGWGVVASLTIFQEDAQLNLVRSAAVRFFRQHEVSIETQISVMYCLQETRAAQKMQRHFRALMSEHLPEELRRTVSEELWVSHLTSLDLIWHIRWWHEDFASELALLVHEEVVASKTVLCKEGHASIAAYYILSGRLEVVSSHACGAMPDFTDGMWVEETALVSPIRRRTSTIVTPILTRLMTVPTQAFHDLIGALGLENKFEEFREKRLARGLCGRCGDVGDHFTHACPHARDPGFARLRRASMNKRTKKMASHAASDGSLSLVTFLHAHRLSGLAPLLQEENVSRRVELEDLDFEALDAKLAGNEGMRQELSMLSELVREQQEQVAFQVSGQVASARHLAFLSHYKLESGTEAALMRQELDRVLLEDNEPLACRLHVPIFLDSEDLSDLQELQEHVRRSHNLVLLLTKDVLLRPWVLVEIATAIEADVHLVPVEVIKPGAGFDFPDEAYYARLAAGQVLDPHGQTLLLEHGIELKDVERALRTVFQKIALPYSPHRSETIRMAEVKAIYKQLFSSVSRTSLLANRGSAVGASTSSSV